MSKTLSGNQIRSTFLKFFEENGHAIVPSSSLVPSNDPTLMFVNSGMVQFKNTFLGLEERAYTRATSSQRCVRAGGKHNDLENVGQTARHHTFFEMLGNFSFGDYFKEDAIIWAWKLVTEELKLDPARLCVTVYEEDDEAYNIWHKKVGVAKEDIIRIGDNKGKRYGSDNFWTMGDDGPCGPCTEIFYDHGAHIWGGRPGTPEEDGDRWVEIWNLVFMQYFMQGGDVVRKLERTGVDTGSGLERVMAVCQGVNSNYDTDIFQSIIQQTAQLSGTVYGAGTDSDTSLRVIADHLRAMSFLMIDGVMPANEGRGYVLRRIMRRAMRHGHLLGMEQPFIHRLVPTLVTVMGDAYPELARGAQMVSDTIKIEEQRFGKTLSNGLKLLAEETAALNKGATLNGEVAFKLYDTYGFPLDLTQDALRERNIGVDEKGFERAMSAQRERARAAGRGGTGQTKLADVWYTLENKLPATEFLGYDKTRAEAQVVALVDGAKTLDKAATGQTVQLVVNQTPFYGESGGQVGDTGRVVWAGGSATVTDTQKILGGHFFAHSLHIDEGTLSAEQVVDMQVDAERRNAIRRNHSATHLLHTALRNVLGSHVFQKGSVVNEHKTRFDFSQPQAVTPQQLAQIEAQVNSMIWANTPVTTRLMDKDEAVENGAMALFGEKYADEVRVLFMGESGDYCSVELCGGTHVQRTGDIGLLKITSESAVAAGVRRVEAVTGQAAVAYYNTCEQQLKAAAVTLKTTPEDLPQRLEALQQDVKKLKQDVKKAKQSSALSAADLLSSAEDLNGVRFIGATVEELEPAALRELVDDLKNRMGSGVVVLAAPNGEKSAFVAGVTKDLTSRYKAGDLVNAAAATVGGKGGGRPDMAMAGGALGDLAAAIAAARATLAS